MVGEGEAVDKILSGEYEIPTELLERYDADILQVFIKRLCQRDHLPSITPIISGSDFRTIFQKTKEFTSSSPLGIHIGHYKLATQSNYLSDIHATFMSLPFQYGFSLKRWHLCVIV